MSERQAKTKRKNEIKEIPKKKKSILDIISNIIIIILILAVLGIGGWAVYSKFSQQPSGETNETVTTPTVSDLAQTEGVSVEEYLAKYGIADAEGITGESYITDAMPYMTLANYAAFSGTDVATVKESMGLEKDYADDTLMSVIIEEMTAAEQTSGSKE